MSDGEPRRDPMAPPEEPCECWCMHCGRTFMSDQIWLQKIIGDPHGMEGFWMCPTPNCGGAGFTFDIFPTDPDHPANEGWHFCDDDEGGDDEDADDGWQPDEDEDQDAEYDPAEPTYAEMDDALAAEGDIEGDEWKYPDGLQPPTESSAQTEARREREEEERKYDEPDARPREVHYNDLHPDDGRSSFSDDDIPF